MDIQEVIRRLSSESIDEQLTVLRSLLGKDASPEVYPLLLANLTSQDNSAVFLSLTLLMKEYPARVHQDAELLRPQFLTLLTSGDGPIIDRAIWGLSITGASSVHTLLDFIAQSTNDYQLEMGIWALGRNAHIRQFPVLVVDTLRLYLNSTNPQVQDVALNMLMEMSPLRPFRRLDASSYDFEPVYSELQAVAQFLLENTSEEREKKWLTYNLELLNNRNQ